MCTINHKKINACIRLDNTSINILYGDLFMKTLIVLSVIVPVTVMIPIYFKMNIQNIMIYAALASSTALVAYCFIKRIIKI